MIHHRHRDDQQIEDGVSTGGSSKESKGPEETGTSKAPEAAASLATRNRVIIALVALVLVAVASIVWTTSRGQDPPAEARTTAETSQGSAPSSSSTTQQPTGSGSETAAPTATGGDANELPVPLEPVPLDETADFGDEVSAELVDLAAIQAEGQGVGEISGPAIRVTVGLLNGTSQPLSLDAVTVTLYFGSELTPAPSISDPGTVPFRGSLAPGESAQGVYTFSIAEDDRDNISITVSHSPTSSIVVFNGAVT